MGELDCLAAGVLAQERRRALARLEAGVHLRVLRHFRLGHRDELLVDRHGPGFERALFAELLDQFAVFAVIGNSSLVEEPVKKIGDARIESSGSAPVQGSGWMPNGAKRRLTTSGCPEIQALTPAAYERSQPFISSEEASKASLAWRSIPATRNLRSCSM